MRIIGIIIIIYLLKLSPSLCQVTFDKTIPSLEDQIGEDIIQTDDSCYIVIGGQVGYFHQWPLNHFLMYKLNQKGDIIWKQLLGEWFDDSHGLSLVQSHDNEYIGCGMGSGLLIEPYLVKLNPEGDTSWAQVIDLESGYNVALSVCQTYDHGFALCGTLSRASMFVIKTDSTGSPLWLKTLDDPEYQNESAECIIETIDSSLVICGYKNDSLALIKLSPEGDSIWMKYYHEMPAGANSVKQADDNSFIITGWVKRENYTKDVLLLKADESGNFIWSKTFGGNEDDYAVDIVISDDQCFILCGTTNSIGIENSDVYLIKTDYKGDTLWTKTFGGNFDEEGLGIDYTYDGGFIISGYKYLNDTLYNIYLIKTDEKGMVGIEDERSYQTEFLSVFPNPASGVLNVKSLVLSSGNSCLLSVVDIFGRPAPIPGPSPIRVKGETIKLDVSSLPPGIYFISLLEDGKRVAGGKFVVAR